jgi:glutaminase
MLHHDLAADEADHTPVVSTGHLPEPHVVAALLAEAHERYSAVHVGTVADYIPALAEADPSWFGLSVVSVGGARFAAGDSGVPFSIQSVSKPFVFALIVESLGYDEARLLLGVDSTGLPFNSVMAIELNDERTMNPMVNAGAIAATSVVPGDSVDEKWEFILDGLSKFAGRRLEIDERVLASELETNQRNQGIARLLESYGRVYSDPLEATLNYTKQCTLIVTVNDLAVMGATLADGGINPITGVQVVSADVCKRVLSVMATAGLYEHSGAWLYEIGLPAKSGVSGAIVAIAPGKGGMATFSPPLDEAGNSVRGQLATKFLSDLLGLNMFASRGARND